MPDNGEVQTQSNVPTGQVGDKVTIAVNSSNVSEITVTREPSGNTWTIAVSVGDS